MQNDFPSIVGMTSDDLRAIIAQAAEEAAKKVVDEMSSRTPVSLSEEYATREEVCDFLKISKPTFHNYANSGAFVIKKVGRRTLVDMSDLRRKVESGEISRYKHRRDTKNPTPEGAEAIVSTCSRTSDKDKDSNFPLFQLNKRRKDAILGSIKECESIIATCHDEERVERAKRELRRLTHELEQTPDAILQMETATSRKKRI